MRVRGASTGEAVAVLATAYAAGVRDVAFEGKEGADVVSLETASGVVEGTGAAVRAAARVSGSADLLGATPLQAAEVREGACAI
jgi:hypothetical protein